MNPALVTYFKTDASGRMVFDGLGGWLPDDLPAHGVSVRIPDEQDAAVSEWVSRKIARELGVVCKVRRDN